MSLLTPSTVNFGTGIVSEFSTSIVNENATLYPYNTSIIGPAILQQADGTFTRYEDGLLAVMYRWADSGSGSIRYYVNLFDLTTGSRVQLLDEEEVSHSDVEGLYPLFQSGIRPITSGHWGYIYWLSNRTTPGIIARLVRWGWFDDSGTATYAKKATSFSGDIGSPTINHITDIVPIPKSPGIDFIVARGQIDPATEKHLYCLVTLLNLSYGSPASSDDFLAIWSKAFTTADWATWTDNPDTALAVQVVRCNRSAVNNNIVVALGDWVASPTIHPAVSNPKLALIAGAGQTARKNTSMATYVGAGGVIQSHVEGAANLHGMVVNQLGEVFVVGNGGLKAANDHLIEKYYAWDLGATEPVAFVDHDDADNGELGHGYASAADTHVYSPIWTGSLLIVMDYSAAATEVVVFDHTLTFVRKFTLSDNQADSRRWIGGKESHPWFSRAH